VTTCDPAPLFGSAFLAVKRHVLGNPGTPSEDEGITRTVENYLRYLNIEYLKGS
jgi:hypothetical protein